MTVLVLDVAVFPVFSFEPTMIAEIEQGIHIIVNEDENLRVTFCVIKNDNIIGNHFLGEYKDRFVNESEAFIEKFGDGN